MKTINTLCVSSFMVWECFVIMFCQNTFASDYYWVGGTGKWSDYANHWSTTSGGLVFHTQVPSPFDNVLFDGNSFASAGDTVIIDTTLIYCNSMDWSGSTNNPVFLNDSGIYNPLIKIYGSLTLASGVQWQIEGAVSFEATSGTHTINTNGIPLTDYYYWTTNIEFNGNGGAWVLQDSLTCGRIWINGGTLRTNNQRVNSMGQIRVYPTPVATFLLGTSEIRCRDWWVYSTGATLDADSSIITVGETGYFMGGSSEIYNDVNLGIYGEWSCTGCTVHDINFEDNGDIMSSSNNTIHDVNFSGNGGISGWGVNNIFNNVTIAGDGYIQGTTGNIFNRMIFNGNTYIDGDNYFDTLIFNNPGKTITLDTGNTQTITGDFFMFASPGFPIALQSSAAGTQATISKASDTVCVDYIYMQDINATGGAVFYAGLNSANISNNTGWIWSNCVLPMSDVWPGDANADKIADNLDILSIGVGYNETGPVRPGANLSWTAQPCLNWGGQFANTVNIVNADCDGSGIIDASDTTAVSLNYGQTHAKTSYSSHFLNAPELYFDIPTGNIYPGSQVSIPVNLGTTINQANDVYGIAFTVIYPSGMIEAGSLSFDFSTSWLGNSGNTIHLAKDFSGSGETDFALCRTNHQNISGYGTIATLNFIIDNNASGSLLLSFSDILAITNAEIVIPMNVMQDTVVITGSGDFIPESGISIYPNPAYDVLNISCRNTEINQLTVSGITGEKIISLQPGNSQLYRLDVSSLSAGTYFLELQTGNGKIRKCISILKQD